LPRSPAGVSGSELSHPVAPSNDGSSPSSAGTIKRGAEASLRRLGTNRIDLYYAHADDPKTPLEESLAAFHSLVQEGKVRYIGASNYSASRLAEAISISDREGYTRFAALQPHYNLVHRSEYEGRLASVCRSEKIACVPYAALADGFLTGKYQPGQVVLSQRADDAMAYMGDRGIAALQALDEVAAAHNVTVAAVALAWLQAQPTVTAPIASARTPEQLADLLPSVQLKLTPTEISHLSNTAGDPNTAQNP
jgi:aryl-alcohol dehydrogenase-like predicted oxidoreductase